MAISLRNRDRGFTIRLPYSRQDGRFWRSYDWTGWAGTLVVQDDGHFTADTLEIVDRLIP